MTNPVEGELFRHTHAELVDRARKWLRRKGCKVVLAEFVSMTQETPDAIGWRGTSGESYLIEVKVSRSDFLRDRKKAFRIEPGMGVGAYRYYMCPPGMIRVDELPAGWGLLYVHKKTVTLEAGQDPQSTGWPDYTWRFNERNQQGEIRMLLSAINRMAFTFGHTEIERLMHVTYAEKMSNAAQ